MHKWMVILLLPSACPVTVLARADAEDDGLCRNGEFSSQRGTFGLAAVQGQECLHLLGDMDGCPRTREAACRWCSYVIAGDTLITGRQIDGHRCGYFAGKRDDIAGWVASGRLQASPVSARPALAAGGGEWRDGDNALNLTSNPGASLTVEGDAYWPHTGEISARSTPHSDVLKLVEEGDIREVAAHLVGDLLVVADSLKCGGADVSFNGVYRHRSSMPPGHCIRPDGPCAH